MDLLASGKPGVAVDSKDDNSSNVDDDVVCCICFNGDVEDENEIVICSGCECSVHQGCYGIVTVPADDWYCKKCTSIREWEAQGKKTVKPEIKCFVCPHPEGAFSPTIDGHWCHTVCASWIPELGFNDTKLMDSVIGAEEKARINTACDLCGVKGGVIQCIHGQCRYAFHVMCGWKHKLRLEVREVPPMKEGDPFDVGQLAYCAAHRNQPFDPAAYVERNSERYRDDPDVMEKEKREGKKKRKKPSDDDATDPEEEDDDEDRKPKKGRGRPKKKGKEKEKASKKGNDKADADPEKKSDQPPSESAISHKCPNCGSTDIGHLCSSTAKDAPEDQSDERKPRKRGRPKSRKAQEMEELGEELEELEGSRRSNRAKKKTNGEGTKTAESEQVEGEE